MWGWWQCLPVNVLADETALTFEFSISENFLQWIFVENQIQCSFDPADLQASKQTIPGHWALRDERENDWPMRFRTHGTSYSWSTTWKTAYHHIFKNSIFIARQLTNGSSRWKDPYSSSRYRKIYETAVSWKLGFWCSFVPADTQASKQSSNQPIRQLLSARLFSTKKRIGSTCPKIMKIWITQELSMLFQPSWSIPHFKICRQLLWAALSWTLSEDLPLSIPARGKIVII